MESISYAQLIFVSYSVFVEFSTPNIRIRVNDPNTKRTSSLAARETPLCRRVPLSLSLPRPLKTRHIGRDRATYIRRERRLPTAQPFASLSRLPLKTALRTKYGETSYFCSLGEDGSLLTEDQYRSFTCPYWDMQLCRWFPTSNAKLLIFLSTFCTRATYANSCPSV